MGMKRTGCGSWIAFALFFLLGIFSIHHYLHPQSSPSHISQFIGFDRISLEGVLDRASAAHSGANPAYGFGPKRSFCRIGHIPVDGRLLLILKDESRTVPFGGSSPIFV